MNNLETDLINIASRLSIPGESTERSDLKALKDQLSTAPQRVGVDALIEILAKPITGGFEVGKAFDTADAEQDFRNNLLKTIWVWTLVGFNTEIANPDSQKKLTKSITESADLAENETNEANYLRLLILLIAGETALSQNVYAEVSNYDSRALQILQETRVQPINEVILKMLAGDPQESAAAQAVDNYNVKVDEFFRRSAKV